MFLRRTERKKNGKTHHYWNVVENKRLEGGRVVQRHVLYLGEINSSQADEWCSGMCCISARSTPRRRRRGARRSKCLTRTPAVRERWRCFRRIDARRSQAMHPSFNFACPRCSFVVRGNGAPAGWPDSCGRSFSSIGSGPIICRRTGNERGGIRSCKCWRPIG